jgi:hypothetical protein
VRPEPFETRWPLADIQGLFAAALVDVTKRRELLTACRGDEWLVGHRFDLYRNNLRASWEKALAAAFPVLQRYVGEEFFLAMSGLYGGRFPSRSGDLNLFGDSLPSFLEQFSAVSEHPWLADLARLEWAVHGSHYAANEGALAAEAVAQMSEGTLDTLNVELHPTCRLIHSPWDIAALWLWHQAPEQGSWTDDIRRPVVALVCRPRWKVAVRALGAGEAAGLAHIVAGARLGDSLDAAFTADPEMDVAAVFSSWLRDGLLVESAPSRDGASAHR